MENRTGNVMAVGKPAIGKTVISVEVISGALHPVQNGGWGAGNFSSEKRTQKTPGMRCIYIFPILPDVRQKRQMA